MTNNRSLAPHGNRFYLLRSLIRCADCGHTYAGSGDFYRCGSQLSAAHPDPAKWCRAKRISTTEIEAAVWADIREFVHNPGPALAEAQRQLRGRMEQSANLDAERRRLAVQLDAKEAERQRVMTLYRRGRIDLDEADKEMEDIAREAGVIRGLLDSLNAQAELSKVLETRLTDGAVMLAALRGRIEAIDLVDDVNAKREVVELLVERITVQTEPSEPHKRKRAEITVKYLFGAPQKASHNSTRTCTDNDCNIVLTKALTTA